MEAAAKPDREAKREQRRSERREQRRLSFDSQSPVFEYAVRAATPAADALRARILSSVQPVAGTPLRWTQRSCATETLWDDPSGTLKSTGAVLVTQSSLDAASCTAEERTKSSLQLAHQTADSAAARSTHVPLAGLAAANKQSKVWVEAATTDPASAPVLVVQGLERHRGALAAVDTTQGLGKAALDRFWGPGAAVELGAVCDRSLTVRQWVLEEEQALPPRDGDERSSEGRGKRERKGKARQPRDRHRSWARLTVWTDAAGTTVHHASLHMKAASSKRETDAARRELPTTTHTDLKAAGMVEAVPLLDARYRCGS